MSLARLLDPPAGLDVDFAAPVGAEALTPADSISWRVFRNPVTLFIGGVAAVSLELAEPSVRAGVWDHSSFRKDPLTRLRRTGMAAMITVYAPRAAAERMIARVVAMHDQVRGTLDDGTPYYANDTRLLDWVQATASFGFIHAYHGFAHRLTEAQISAAFAEGAVAAGLYGATGAPRTVSEWEEMLAATLPTLEPSAVLDEFLQIMRTTPILPRPLRPVQRTLVKAAITMLPDSVRARLKLTDVRLNAAERLAIRLMARASERLLPPSAPQRQAERRMAGSGPPHRPAPDPAASPPPRVFS